MKKITNILLTLFLFLSYFNIAHSQCTHTFTGYDSWGDGWNGASVTVTVNAVPVGVIAMTTGSQESITFQAADGDLIKLDWTSGDYDSEISWDCTDGGNNTIAMGVWGTTAVGVGACPAATPCATLDYFQDFETGSTLLTATTGSGAQVTLDGTAANASVYGLHMQGNTSSGWGSSYSTGAAAFSNSPTHIASVSREICAPSQPTVKMTFNKMQTYTWNVNYSWFRVTVNGTPIPDVNGVTYFNGSNNTWTAMEYNLSQYTGNAFTIAFETCNKYYTGYTSTGMGGDASYIDDILISQTSGLSPPSAPVAISGNSYPNSGEVVTYTISPVQGATSYTWTSPNGWLITTGQGTTSITVITDDNSGTLSVTATNSAGTSSPSTLTVTSALLVTSYPYTTAFENETNDVSTASTTGFSFNENGWRNVDGDDGDWRTDAGGTGSTNSGPGGGSSSGQSDHNPGTSSGKYIYTEASSPMYPSKEFHLWSPPFNLTSLTSPTLTFWYSMYSASGAALALQYSTNNGSTWASINLPFMCTNTFSNAVISQDMGTTWRQGFVDLSSLQSNSNIMFRFIVTTGTSWDGDVCLDDIKLVDAANTSVDVGENITLNSNAYSSAYGLVLNGNSAQTLTPDGQNVSNISIANSNGVTLNGGDLKINGILTLTDGVLTTGAYKVITAAAVPGAISGGSTTSFINGNLRRFIPSTSTGTYEFPIGNGTGTSNYHKVDLINSSLSGVNYIDASVGNMPSGNDFDLNCSQIGSMMTEVYDKQWALTPNTQPTGGTYGVNLYLNGVNGLYVNDNTFTIVKRDDNSTSWGDWETHEFTTTIPQAGQPGRTVASGYGQKSGFMSFSLFGFGGAGGGALPIVLTSWNGWLVDGIEPTIALEWVVESQQNNDYYTIEKSLDGYEWVEIERIGGAGNCNTTLTYRTYDKNPVNGYQYYRLSQTDYDGQFENFDIISVLYNRPIKLSINPNPVEETLTLYLEEELRGVTTVKIFNSKGQRVYGKTFVGDWEIIELNVDKFKKGYYLLNVDHKRREGSLKFIKK